MAEGSTGARSARRNIAHKRGHNPQEFYSGLAIIGLALLGPVLGLIFGSTSSGYLAGVYSLPLAIFGLAAMLFDVRNHQDFWGGVGLVAFALFSLWAGSDLPGMRGFAFGPGTAPRLFALLLVATGAGVALMGLLSDGPSPGRFSFRALLIVAVAIVLWVLIERLTTLLWPHRVITGPLVATAILTVVTLGAIPMLERVGLRGTFVLSVAVLGFAMFIRPFGLVIASFTAIMVAAAASDEVKWIETTIWAVVLTAFCAFLFPYALNLPLSYWPRL